MVSYPADDTRSVSYTSSRRTPSVASSSASTFWRHRPHTRSRAGTSSSRAPANEFPIFAHTGDVEIIITADPKIRRRRDSGSGRGHIAEQKYLLHRLILAQCSGFFDAGTSEESSMAQAQGQAHPSLGGQIVPYSERGTATGSKRWKYELDWGSREDSIPMLIPTGPSSSIFGEVADYAHSRPPPTTRPKPQPPPSGFFRSMANFSALHLSSHSNSNPNAGPDPLHPSDLLMQAYDSLFRIFYNYPPALDAVNIAQAYVECKALIQIADMYEAAEVVGPRVDHHLLRFGSRLWRQIAKYPPSYLKLGYLARSKAIFGEAVIHVVGNWPACAQQLGHTGPLAPRTVAPLPPQGLTQLPQEVFELIEDKVDELEELKVRIEFKLWRLTLTTSRGERVTPANAWTDWLAMSLFRQWLAENTTPPPAPILKGSPRSGRGSSRGSTSVSLGDSHRPSSSSRHQPPPLSYNGSALSASAAADPRGQHDRRQSTSGGGGAGGAPPPFNTGRVFRLLGAGGQAYLPHAELKAFLKLQPGDGYDRDRLRRFERRVDDLKNVARDAVKPLMRNFLSVDVVGAGSERDSVAVGHLTCVRVADNEFPWDG